MPLRDILGILRDAYSRTIGVEYMHIQEPEQKEWIQARVETPPTPLDGEQQRRILERLNAAEAFEGFLHTKYLGQKRFSLEGAESLIPMLDALLDDAADAGMAEVVLGTAHRGRLNVLANIDRQELRPDLPRVRGRARPRVGAGLGRREVPRRLDRHAHRAVGQQDRRDARVEPEPPRSGRPGGRGHGAGQGGPPRRHRRPDRRCCRCSSTATPRSRARAWSPRR